jgi:hypothetical protein
MTQPAHPGPETLAAEARLADALALDDGQLANVRDTLAALLTGADLALFSDRIVAQVRAFANDLAGQLAAAAGTGQADDFSGALLAEPAILAHLHAIGIEAQLTGELAERLSLDPVVPPLLQTLLASPEAQVAADAAALIAAQARFEQAQRRGELPLDELPGDLRRLAVLACGAEAMPDLETVFRDRIALMRRVIGSLGAEASAALDVTRAGVCLFATALALVGAIDRDVAILAMTRAQRPRLALTLLTAGLDPAAVQRQLLALHPDAEPLRELDGVQPGRAAAILAAAAGHAG